MAPHLEAKINTNRLVWNFAVWEVRSKAYLGRTMMLWHP